MIKRDATTTHPEANLEKVARAAWVVTFLVPLALIALLCLAKSAEAISVEGPLAPAPGLDEELEEGYGEEDCEMDEEGFVECDGLEDEEEESDGPYPPDECLLQTAQARAFTYSAGDKLRLVIRYTATEPTGVSIDYRLKGGRGALNLGKVKRHFGKQGLLQISENLTDAGMSVAQAARSFLVKLSIPGAPGYCNRFYTRHLTVQKAVHNQVVWLQSDSVFGT